MENSNPNTGIWLPLRIGVQTIFLSMLFSFCSGESGRDLSVLALLNATSSAPVLNSDVSMGQDIPAGAIYVSATRGNDANTGSELHPVRTLKRAVERAAYYYLTEVRIAGGTYDNSSAPSDSTVTLTSDISLLGGYSPSDWAIRDPTLYVTAVEDVRKSGGSWSDPLSTILCYNLTSATHIEGLTVRSANVDLAVSASVGITISSSSPVIQGSVVDGIYAKISGSPLIENNLINGSVGAYDSVTITMTGNTVDPGVFGSVGVSSHYKATLSNNTIYGGAGYSSYGILITAKQASLIDNNTIVAGFPRCNANAISVSSSSTATVTISNNTIIAGNSGCENYGIKNGATSIITDNTIQGGDAGIAFYGIYLDGSATNASVISNNTITGGKTRTSYGIYGSTSSATIQNNTILGGRKGAERSYGIYLDGGSPIIANNTIDGGFGSSTYGIQTSMLTLTYPRIEGNTIFGGNATALSSGIYITGSPQTIYNNLIHGGQGVNYSRGISISSEYSGSKIWNNTIDGGSGADTHALEISDFNKSSVQNNILFTSGGTNRYCIYEQCSYCSPAVVKNNELVDCPTALYFDNGSTAVKNLSTSVTLNGGSSGTLGSFGNISESILFSDFDGTDNNENTMADNDWTLSASAACNILQGGLNLSPTLTADRKGLSRTASLTCGPGNIGAAGWSIGAHESD